MFAAALGAPRRRASVVPALAVAMLAAGLLYVGWFGPHHAYIQAQPRKELASTRPQRCRRRAVRGLLCEKYNSTIFYLGRPLLDLGARDAKKLVDFLRGRSRSRRLTHRKVLAELDREGVRIR